MTQHFIRLQFVLGYGISSAAIAWMGSGHFSHVDCEMEGGFLLGARSDRVGHAAPGVQIRTAGYCDWKDVPVSEYQRRKHMAFLKAQLGKPYDHTAIWGFAAGRNWRDDDSWFCSELQMAALEYAAVVPCIFSPANKIPPVSLLNVFSAIGASVIFRAEHQAKFPDSPTPGF